MKLYKKIIIRSTTQTLKEKLNYAKKSLNNFTLLVCVLIVLSFSFIESNMTVTGGVTRSYATINSLNKQEVNIVVNLTVNIICCAQFRQGNSSKQNLTE